MSKATKNLVFYIIVFFATVALAMGSFFGYKTFLQKDVLIGKNISTDNDFNDIFNSSEEEKEMVSEYVSYKNNKCSVEGEEFEHGRPAKLYSRSLVGVYESCDDFSEIRKCSDGSWSGDDKFQFLSCQKTLNCKTESGTIIENEDIIKMFSKNEVFFGDNCERYAKNRNCVETKLTGGDQFKYEKCVVSESGVCNVLDGDGESKKIPDSTSRLFFSKSSVEYNDSCQKYSKNRFCDNGILDGEKEFSFLYCKKNEASSCLVSGVEMRHGESRILYSKSKAVNNKTCGFFAEIRECNNGELLGKEEYTKIECVE